MASGAGHMTSAIRKQRDECWYAACLFLVFSPDPGHEMLPPIFGVVFFSLLTQSKNSFCRHAKEFVPNI